MNQFESLLPNLISFLPKSFTSLMHSFISSVVAGCFCIFSSSSSILNGFHHRNSVSKQDMIQVNWFYFIWLGQEFYEIVTFYELACVQFMKQCEISLWISATISSIKKSFDSNFSWTLWESIRALTSWAFGFWTNHWVSFSRCLSRLR